MLRNLRRRFRAWRLRKQAFAELHALPDEALYDIGITRDDIDAYLNGVFGDGADPQPGLEAPAACPQSIAQIIDFAAERQRRLEQCCAELQPKPCPG